MSTLMEDDIKRWTAKRKTALVLDIIQGKTTVSEASQAYDLNPSEVEQWVDEGKCSKVEALTPTSAATWSSGALSGGNSFANALFLKSCPYRATSFSHRPHPLVSSVLRRQQLF